MAHWIYMVIGIFIGVNLGVLVLGLLKSASAGEACGGAESESEDGRVSP